MVAAISTSVLLHGAAPSSKNKVEEDRAIYRAMGIIDKRLRAPGAAMPSSEDVRTFLRLALAEEERECVLVMLLDAQLRLIESRVLFAGSLTCATIHPREVVKFALQHNAAAAILAHNHPGGTVVPSVEDIEITKVVKEALGLIDVEMLDHMIVAQREVVSFVESALI